MIWKPKEKELTQAEAIALAKKELEPYWFNSTPLFTGIQKGADISVYPLDPHFIEKPWVIAFVDLTSKISETVIEYLKVYKTRFHHLGIDTLLVVCPSFTFLSQKEVIRKWLEIRKFESNVVVDYNHLLRSAFNIENTPSILIFKKNKTLFMCADFSKIQEVEKNIHQLLWVESPGLAVLPLFHHIGSVFKNISQLTFAKNSKIDFTSRGPTPADDLLMVKKEPIHLNSSQVLLIGEWTHHDAFITTRDPKAELHFSMVGSGLTLIARPHTAQHAPRKVLVELNENPVFDTLSGDHLETDENGNSFLEIKTAEVFSVLHKVPENLRHVTFKFPEAKDHPTEIYQLIFTGE